MKKTMILAVLFLLFGSSAFGHSVGLTWTASTDAAANPTLTYNAYRLNGACPAVAPTSISGSGFTKINTAAVTTTTYSDANIAPGTYCYFATAFLNSTESIPSNDASAIVQPAAPTSFGVTQVTQLFNDGESYAAFKRRWPAKNGMIQVEVPA